MGHLRHTRLWDRWGYPVAATSSAIIEHWTNDGDEEKIKRSFEDEFKALDAKTEFSFVMEARTPAVDLQSVCRCDVNYGSGRLRILMDSHLCSAGEVGRTIALRTSAILPVLSLITARRPRVSARFTIGLGDDAANAQVGFCSAGSSKTVLIPDPSFILSAGYLTFRYEVDRQWIDWKKREDVLFWRGSTTGAPRAVGSFDSIADPFKVLPRLEVCARLNRLARCDVGISNIVGLQDLQLIELVEGNLKRNFVNRIAQLKYKYLLDIDGMTNAWAGLFEALLLGACVIKVGSPSDFSQWFYASLRPWEHYVPVAKDMSDLEDVVDWAMSHKQEASRIAQQGRDFALSLTFDEQMELARSRIVETFRSDRPFHEMAPR